MKNKDRMRIALLSAVACACCTTHGLVGWQRSAMDECKQDAKECTKSPDRCQRESDKCKMNADDKDVSSFASELTAYDRGVFSKFSMDQKQKAMDMADKNKMSPSDAVAKVAGTW